MARAGLFAATAGTVTAAANFFASMLPFDLGLTPDFEPMIVVSHAGAAMTALGLLLIHLKRPRLVLPALGHPLVLCAFAVGAWSALLAPFVEFPLSTLLGSPSAGEGALLYGELAMFIAAAMTLRRFRLGLTVAGIAAAVGTVVPALVAAGWARPGILQEYAAFFAVSAPVLVIAACHRLPKRTALTLGFAAGFPAVVLSNSNSVWIVSALGVAIAIVFAARVPGACWKRIDRRHIAAASVPFTALAVTAGVALIGYEHLVASLTSRLYLDRIGIEALSDRPLSLLIGQGWGRAAEIIVAHLNASRAVLWDESWDATRRGFADIHNFALETVLAAGIPALLGVLAMIMAIAFFSRRALFPVAAGFAIALTALWSVWFLVPFTVPITALAAGWLIRPVRALRYAAWVRAAGSVVLAVMAVSSAAAAIWLTAMGIATQRNYIAEGGYPVACEAMPLDRDRGGYAPALGFARAQDAVFNIETAGQSANASDLARLDRALCAVGRAVVETRAADLLIRPLLFRADIAFRPGLTASRVRYADTLVTWERALVRFLARAPRRTDTAWLYLSWRLRQGDYRHVWEFSKALLARDPNDPVGLWYAGMALVQSSAPDERQQGLLLMRRSLASGVDRIAPISVDLRKEIEGN